MHANRRFRPRWAEIKVQTCESEHPIARRRDRVCVRLTYLLVVPIEDRREQRGGEKIEDNDIDVRMPFDQSEH